MYKSHTNGTAQVSHNSPLQRAVAFVHTHATVANLIGLGGGLLAIVCLLALPASQSWNIRLPLYLVLVVWTLLRPRITLYLLPIAVPWGSLDPVTLGSFKVNSADILVILLVAGWLMSFPLRRLIAPQQDGPLDRATHHFPRFLIYSILALLVAMLLSLTATSSLSLSLKEIVKWLEAFTVLLLGSQYIRTRRHVWTLLIILCLAAVSQALLGYAQYAFDLGPTSFIRSAGLRVYGTFDQPNPYAGYINISLVVLFALVLFGRGLAVRVPSCLALILLIGVELLSQSKGGYLALAVALLFIVITGLSHHRIFITTMLIIVLTLVAFYLAGLVPNSVFAPLLQRAGLVNISFDYPNDVNYANSERLAHWVAGLLMFRDHPLFGVGIGNYANAYSHYAQGIFVISLGQAHNYYINIAAEAGIFGLLSLLWFLSAVFAVAGRSLTIVSKHSLQIRTQLSRPQIGTSLGAARKKLEYGQKIANDRALVIGLIAALLSVCIHNLVDDLYDHSMTSLFTLLIVMLVRLAGSISKREQIHA